MPGRLEFGFTMQEGLRDARPRPATAPMRVLLLGDFGGRAARGVDAGGDLATRPTLRVDHDNFDAVCARLAPQLEINAAGVQHALAFASLDDFHPDRLYAAGALFGGLRDLRRRLQDPAQFAAAAATLSAPAAARNELSGGRSGGRDDELLGRLLGGAAAPSTASAPSAAPTPVSAVEALIRQAVAPHIVPAASPLQAQVMASVDAAAGAQMRGLLHAPAFQALESLWRATHWLLSNLELEDQLQLHLFDVTRGEIEADLRAADGEWARSGLQRALVQRSQDGGAPWSLLLSELSFDASATDQALLAALGALGALAGAPLLAGARPALLGWSDFESAPAAGSVADDIDSARWQALRESPLAPWIGLAAPRWLARQPYGARSDPVEAFAFEEIDSAATHEQFLWAPPAFACALLMARAYAAEGWDGDPNADRDIADLPAVTLVRDGEPALLSCAEGYFGERGTQALLAAGVMPLVGDRSRNAVRVARVQSIAEPPGALGRPRAR